MAGVVGVTDGVRAPEEGVAVNEEDGLGVAGEVTVADGLVEAVGAADGLIEGAE